MKSVKAELEKSKPERVEAFEKGAQAFAKKIVANFKDYEFVSHSLARMSPSAEHVHQYTGESMNPDGMVALLNYREDGVTRTYPNPIRPVLYLTNMYSLFHVLEGRCQGDQVLSVSLSAYLLFSVGCPL